jgi:hypothetical protein
VSVQPDLFKETTAPGVLLGLPVHLADTCRCGETLASIEAGHGPHHAGLRCACGRHRGWVSGVTHTFLTETVKRFGRPTEPIRIRVHETRMAASAGADVT